MNAFASGNGMLLVAALSSISLRCRMIDGDSAAPSTSSSVDPSSQLPPPGGAVDVVTARDTVAIVDGVPIAFDRVDAIASSTDAFLVATGRMPRTVAHPWNRVVELLVYRELLEQHPVRPAPLRVRVDNEGGGWIEAVAA